MYWLNLFLISMVVSIAPACGSAEAPAQSTEATEPAPAAMEQGATPEMVGGVRRPRSIPEMAAAPT